MIGRSIQADTNLARDLKHLSVVPDSEPTCGSISNYLLSLASVSPCAREQWGSLRLHSPTTE